MKTTTLGQLAEVAVAEELRRRKFKIITQNWKTKVCEIDIVAQKAGIIYFVEVKYRSSNARGAGLEHITKRKLQQMQFAARIWNQHHDWNGDWRLLAASVSTNGQDFLMEELLEIE
jgi:uncharacterized protein (TIGR00252 family)